MYAIRSYYAGSIHIINSPATAFRKFKANSCQIIYSYGFINYLGYNLATHGHLVPISGAIKSSAPTIAAQFKNLGAGGTLVLIAGFA